MQNVDKIGLELVENLKNDQSYFIQKRTKKKQKYDVR